VRPLPVEGCFGRLVCLMMMMKIGMKCKTMYDSLFRRMYSIVCVCVCVCACVKQCDTERVHVLCMCVRE
jgi:hypothetical protein